MTATSPSSSTSRRTRPTARPSISRAGRSPPSAPGWCATSTTAPSRSLAEQANGKQLNGPNDMVVHPNDKSIWFTDPGYGAISIYEGQRANTGSAPALPEGSRLSHRCLDRPDHQGRRRAVQAERHRLQPRLQEGLCLRHRHHALSERQEHRLAVRPQRRQAVQPAHADRHDAGRQVGLPGRPAGRHRRQHLGRRRLGRTRL